MTSKQRLTIIMPVYNDWASATRLIEDLATALDGLPIDAEVVAVDDCSTQAIPEVLPAVAPIRRVRALRLRGNVGHQRAIAIGLSHVAEANDTDLIAVMDSDGEDRPIELRRMLETALASPGEIIVAQRKKRSEGPIFRTFYWVYVRLFRMLTGKRIQFGNFSLLGIQHAGRIANNPNIWNNFAATVVTSRLPIRYVPTVRGTRYAGKSTMNFVSLVGHGLGAISVFSEAVFIRILMSSFAVFAFSLLLALGAVSIRLFTPLAIPGWATQVLGFALIISIQALITPIMLAFLMLSSRSTIQMPPRAIAPQMIEAEHELHGAEARA